MVADLGASLGLDWPEYAPQTRECLAQALPGFGSATNPTDLTAAAIGQDGAYERAARAILADPAIDVMIPVLTIASTSDIRSEEHTSELQSLMRITYAVLFLNK